MFTYLINYTGCLIKDPKEVLHQRMQTIFSMKKSLKSGERKTQEFHTNRAVE